MADFETKCKPRVVGPRPQPLDYMARVLYVWYPGKSHGNVIQNDGRNEYHLQNNNRSECEADMILFLCNDRFWDQM